MEKLRLIGRSSALSKLQLEKVRDRIAQYYPSLQIDLLLRESKGDLLPDIPLQTVEGTDFFTSEIYDALRSNEADLAVHSLKDMSSAHFFGGHQFAVPDRDDPRDVLFFHSQFWEKLKNKETIVIGTCSPRREEMAIGFLETILSKWSGSVSLQVRSIRGNVDTRLRKLASGEYDATILAAAGVNRMLHNEDTALLVRPSLQKLKWIHLPLVECTPAPCQGAIVVEALPNRNELTTILQKINNPEDWDNCVAEKKWASQLGTGCQQKFGVTSFSLAQTSVLYGGGRDENDFHIDEWRWTNHLPKSEYRIFNTADYMGSFFEYEYLPLSASPVTFDFNDVYVANYKAVHTQEWINWLQQKNVWASGTRTWKELLSKGIWVKGSADALGIQSLEKTWASPLVNRQRKDMLILTHEDAAISWRQKGFPAIASYRLKGIVKQELAQKMSEANLIFWTSAAQFKLFRNFVNDDAKHACAAGETLQQLREEGINPYIFPCIKAFQQWRTTNTQ